MSPPRCSATTGSASRIPLLIGGATTSRVHTAVKIAPHYERPGGLRARRLAQRGWRRPARRRSRAIGRARPTTTSVRPARQQEADAAGHAGAGARQQDADRLGGLHAACRREVHRRRVFGNYDLAELAAAIDWGPFFQTWDLAGRYPAILDDEVVGEARKVLPTPRHAAKDRRALAERECACRSAWPAKPSTTTTSPLRRRGARPDAMTWRRLRQQTESGRSMACAPPTAARRLRRARDSTGGRLHRPVRGDGRHRCREEGSGSSPPRRTTTSAIMLKALADRLAEAFAERCTSACAPSSGATRPTTPEQRAADRRESTRHPPGARLSRVPDHGVKRAMFDLLCSRRHRHGPDPATSGRHGQRRGLPEDRLERLLAPTCKRRWPPRDQPDPGPV